MESETDLINRTAPEGSHAKGRKKADAKSPAKAVQTLQMYVNDMVAMERDIKEALDWQCDDHGIARHPEASSLVREIAFGTDARLSAVSDLALTLGGGAGKALKEAVATAAGTLAGIYGKFRKHSVSRMLRDDYTALSLGAAAYSMLYATALALRDARAAALAQRHLRELTPLVMRLGQVIPSVVVAELGEEFPNIDAGAAERAVAATVEAWTQEPPSTV